MKPIILVIPGNPVPMGRPRVGPRGATIPERTVRAEREIAELTKIELINHPDRFPLHEEFGIILAFFEGVKAEQHMADIDNCIKTVLDALNGIVWIDDKLVTRIEATIERGNPNPRTEFMITRRKPRR